MNTRRKDNQILWCVAAGLLLPVFVFGQEPSGERPGGFDSPPMQGGPQMGGGMGPGGPMQGGMMPPQGGQQGMRGRGAGQNMGQERPDVMRDVFSRHPGVRPDEVMKFINEQFPDEMKRFQELRQKNAAEAEERISSLVENAIELLEIRQKNAEQFEKALKKTKLDRQAEHMGEKLRGEDVKDKEQASKEIREILEQSFELKQELMKMEVSGLEGEIQKLKEMVEKRQANKKAMIDRRVKELTGKEAELRW